MRHLDLKQVGEFLEKLGKQYPSPARLYLLGGVALYLLGNSRPTMDIDYVGDDIQKDDFQTLLEKIAQEMELHVDAVPIEKFIPIPQGGLQRCLFYRTYGKVEVFIFDPYTIALSKIERGFDTDIEDILFLLRSRQINFLDLERYTTEALQYAKEFDIEPEEMHNHLELVRERL
jgi:hypothetical protein